jgi:hypothetical protein
VVSAVVNESVCIADIRIGSFMRTLARLSESVAPNLQFMSPLIAAGL